MKKSISFLMAGVFVLGLAVSGSQMANADPWSTKLLEKYKGSLKEDFKTLDLSEIDLDGDGKISKAELIIWERKQSWKEIGG